MLTRRRPSLQIWLGSSMIMVMKVCFRHRGISAFRISNYFLLSIIKRLSSQFFVFFFKFLRCLASFFPRQMRLFSFILVWFIVCPCFPLFLFNYFIHSASMQWALCVFRSGPLWLSQILTFFSLYSLFYYTSILSGSQWWAKILAVCILWRKGRSPEIQNVNFPHDQFQEHSCYGLDKCPPTVCVLKTWHPVSCCWDL